MGAGWLLKNGEFWPLCKLLLTCIGAEKTFMQSVSSFLFFFQAFESSLDLCYHTLIILLICLATFQIQRKDTHCSCRYVWRQGRRDLEVILLGRNDLLWRLPGMTGGRMKRCRIYFGHWSPGFLFREIAWWVNATLTLTMS